MSTITCECSPCGRTFTGLSTFDKHQDVNYSRRPAVQCLDPITLGMQLDKHGRWGYPLSAHPRPSIEKMRAENAAGVVQVTPRLSGPQISGQRP